MTEPKPDVVTLFCCRTSEESQNKVIGGIHFREFRKQGFIEVVFCAIAPDEQYRGYGTAVMTQLKSYAREEKMWYLITYADDGAVDYFKRQGFTKDVNFDRSVWGGYIKDYEGATIMTCRVDSRIQDDFEMPLIIKQQRKAVVDKLKQLSTHHNRYKGIDAFKTQGVQRIAINNLANLSAFRYLGSATIPSHVPVHHIFIHPPPHASLHHIFIHPSISCPCLRPPSGHWMES